MQIRAPAGARALAVAAVASVTPVVASAAAFQGTQGTPPAETQLPDVTITAREELVEPVALDERGSRDVLRAEELEELVHKDLNELVQFVPGISTRPYNGADSVSPNFAVRGLLDDGLTEYVLVTVDGVPVNPMPYGWTAMSFLPLFSEQARAVELVKGGMSTRWSPNTVGGVLNFYTQPIPDEQRITFHSAAGADKYFSNSFSYGDRVGGFGWLVSAGDRHGDGYRDAGDFDQQFVDGKLEWARDDGGWTSVKLTHFDNYGKRPGGLTPAQFAADPYQNTRPDNYHQGRFDALSFVDHRRDTARDWSELYGWATSTYNRISGPTPYSDTATTQRRRTYTQNNVNLGWRAERDLSDEHRLHYGVRASYEWLPELRNLDRPIGGGPVTQTLDADYELWAISGHVDDTIALGERWTLNPGVRVEWVPRVEGRDDVTGEDTSESFFDVLPAVGASYALSEHAALFANYQRSFRAPQVFGLDTNPAPPNGQTLEFEHGEQAELGVRARIGGGVSGSVVGWHTSFDDVGITVNGLYETLGNVVANGVDLGLEWNAGEALAALEGFELRALATLQDSELEDAASPANDGNETPYAWDEKLTWLASYAFGDNVVSLSGYHIGESFSDDANTRVENAAGTLGINRSRTIWDAQIAREMELRRGGTLRVALGLQNLFDEEWYIHSRLGGRILGTPQSFLASIGLSF